MEQTKAGVGQGETVVERRGRASQGTCRAAHRHGQRCGDGLWEQGVGWAEEGKEGKIGTTVMEQ